MARLWGGGAMPPWADFTNFVLPEHDSIFRHSLKSKHQLLGYTLSPDSLFAPRPSWGLPFPRDLQLPFRTFQIRRWFWSSIVIIRTLGGRGPVAPISFVGNVYRPTSDCKAHSWLMEAGCRVSKCAHNNYLIVSGTCINISLSTHHNNQTINSLPCSGVDKQGE